MNLFKGKSLYGDESLAAPPLGGGDLDSYTICLDESSSPKHKKPSASSSPSLSSSSCSLSSSSSSCSLSSSSSSCFSPNIAEMRRKECMGDLITQWQKLGYEDDSLLLEPSDAKQEEQWKVQQQHQQLFFCYEGDISGGDSEEDVGNDTLPSSAGPQTSAIGTTEKQAPKLRRRPFSDVIMGKVSDRQQRRKDNNSGSSLRRSGKRSTCSSQGEREQKKGVTATTTTTTSTKQRRKASKVRKMNESLKPQLASAPTVDLDAARSVIWSNKTQAEERERDYPAMDAGYIDDDDNDRDNDSESEDADEHCWRIPATPPPEPKRGTLARSRASSSPGLSQSSDRALMQALSQLAETSSSWSSQQTSIENVRPSPGSNGINYPVAHWPQLKEATHESSCLPAIVVQRAELPSPQSLIERRTPHRFADSSSALLAPPTPSFVASSKSVNAPLSVPITLPTTAIESLRAALPIDPSSSSSFGTVFPSSSVTAVDLSPAGNGYLMVDSTVPCLKRTVVRKEEEQEEEADEEKEEIATYTLHGTKLRQADWSNASALSYIPSELFAHIFSYLDWRSICSLTAVCASWYQLCSDNGGGLFLRQRAEKNFNWLFWLLERLHWQVDFIETREDEKEAALQQQMARMRSINNSHQQTTSPLQKGAISGAAQQPQQQTEKKFDMHARSGSRIDFLKATVLLLKDFFSKGVKGITKHTANEVNGEFNVHVEMLDVTPRLEYVHLLSILNKQLQETSQLLVEVQQGLRELNANYDIIELSLRRYYHHFQCMFTPAGLPSPSYKYPSEIIDDLDARRVWEENVGADVYYCSFDRFYEMLQKEMPRDAHSHSEFHFYMNYFLNFPKDDTVTVSKWNLLTKLFGPYSIFYTNFSKYVLGKGFLGLINRIRAEEICKMYPGCLIIRFSRTVPTALAFSIQRREGEEVYHATNSAFQRKNLKLKESEENVPIDVLIEKRFPTARLIPMRVDGRTVMETCTISGYVDSVESYLDISSSSSTSCNSSSSFGE